MIKLELELKGLIPLTRDIFIYGRYLPLFRSLHSPVIIKKEKIGLLGCGLNNNLDLPFCQKNLDLHTRLLCLSMIYVACIQPRKVTVPRLKEKKRREKIHNNPNSIIVR